MIAEAGAAGAGCVRAAVSWTDELVRGGVSIREGVLPETLVAALADEARRLADAEKLRRAGVGRAEDHELNREIRRDRVRWLDGSTLAQVQFLEAMEALRLEANRDLMLGLFDFEAHFALYEPGAFYARHVDAFRGARNRILSVVLYLNENWQAGDGGELALYRDDAPDDEEPQQLVAPVGGRLVVLLSEEVPHAVLAANKDRYSIAGWFRVREAV